MTTTRLRLGLVGPVPPPNGGMAMQTRQLRELLVGEGVEVDFLATNPPYCPAWVEKIRGLRAAFRLIPYLYRAIRLAGRVDVIHLMANSGWSWQLFSAPVIWSGWFRRTPVIVNYRGGEAEDYFQKSFSRIKPTLNKACCMVVPSGFLGNVFAQFGVESREIPNIIDVQRFQPGSTREKKQGFTLIITRNLEQIYGIDTAIRAVALAREANLDIRLLIAGSGPQLGALQHLVKKLELDAHVEFVGRLDANAIVPFYQGADALLNPTTVDNMPNSVLEALACGVPVISTDVGGVPYIVENESTALLVSVGDEQGMAEAIARLHDDEELKNRLVANGLEEVQQYTWPNVKARWMALYHTVAGGRAA